MNTTVWFFSVLLRILWVSALLAQSFLFSYVSAQVPPTVPVTPTVVTDIAIFADGTAPFDANTRDGAWDQSGNGTNAWQDAWPNNNYVRLGDTVTYEVEISINDSDATNVYSDVILDEFQAWTEVPAACKGTIDGLVQDSFISPDGRTLTCFLGDVVEGTKIEFLATAEVLVTAEHDNTIWASADANATWPDWSMGIDSSDPVTVKTTAGYGVDLSKSLPTFPPDDNGVVAPKPPKSYSATSSDNPFPGVEWYIYTYTLEAKYIRWSAMAAHDGSFMADYLLKDYFTYQSGELWTNAQMVSCTTPTLWATLANCSATAMNTAWEIEIDIDIDDVDVRNTSLFKVEVEIWIPASDVPVQDEDAGTPALVTNNWTYFTDGLIVSDETPWTEIVEPVSQVWNTPNDDGDPATTWWESKANNWVSTSFYYIPPSVPWGACVSQVGFKWANSNAASRKKTFDHVLAPWQNRQFFHQLRVGWFIDWDVGQTCASLDTEMYTFNGMEPTPRLDLTYNSLNVTSDINSSVRFWFIPFERFDNAKILDDYWLKVEYSIVPHNANWDSVTCWALPAGSQHQRTCYMQTTSCEDDMDGGWYDRYDAKDCDPYYGGSWNNWTTCPINASDVTRVRQTHTRDQEQFETTFNELNVDRAGRWLPPLDDNQLFITNSFDVNLKTTLSPGDVLPITEKSSCLGGARLDTTIRYDDDPSNITSANASWEYAANWQRADRIRIIWTTISLGKTTVDDVDPTLTVDLVSPGDVITYKLTPIINWPFEWTTDVVVSDVANAALTYVPWSTVFSGCGMWQVWIDNNTWWSNTNSWTITNVASDLANGNPLCEITYQMQMSNFALPWAYNNKATMDTANRSEGDGKIYRDEDVPLGTRQGNDSVTILPGPSSFDVRKLVDTQLFPTNVPFTYELTYANLGPEDFNGWLTGAFIDVLPYTANDWRSAQALWDGWLGDWVCGATQESTSWPNSCRQPPSDFHGTYQLTDLNMPNGESNCYVTDADPATIDMYDVPNHGPNGTIHTWTALPSCTTDPSTVLQDISAFYFETPTLPAGTPRYGFDIELTPTGNAANDIYTNSFGWEIPDIDLKVISNDVYVTMYGFDLALDKVVNTAYNPWPYFNGSNVQFDINVYNQGTIAWSWVEVIDYIPAGFTFDAASNPDWTLDANGNPVTILWSVPVSTGAITLPIILTVDGSVTDGELVNRAEISSATAIDEDGNELLDVLDDDSTPDTDQGNDNQPINTWDPTDNEVDENALLGNNNGTCTEWGTCSLDETLSCTEDANCMLPGDEDDHDLAGITLAVFDLALAKTLDTAQLPVYPWDDVTFTIEITNQWDLTGHAIEITDYVPANLTLNDTDRSMSGAVAVTTIPGPLALGDTETVDITFTIDSSFQGDSITNRAEISSADNDTDPENTPPTDIDSTPDGDTSNDNQPSDAWEEWDDEIWEDGLNGEDFGTCTEWGTCSLDETLSCTEDTDCVVPWDEDDHDPASVMIGQIFDLALTKVVDTGNTTLPIIPGSDVTYTIQVCNQGTLDAYNITVSDYIPADMTLNDINWTETAGIASTTIASLPAPVPGATSCVDLSLTMTVDADFAGTSITNYAEISAADDDEDAENTPPTDIDSTPDADDSNDAWGEAGGESDNQTDGNGADDEDDHDPAMIEMWVYDLALSKVLNTTATTSPVYPGDDVVFTIEVTNQWYLIANNVEITDYIPTGLILNDANWTETSGIATTSIAGPLNPGDSTTVDITFMIDSSFQGDSITNRAEISWDNAAEYGTSDEDSTPDGDISNDNQPSGAWDITDNEIWEDGINGWDEDDHDVAQVVMWEPVNIYGTIYFDDEDDDDYTGDAPISGQVVTLYDDMWNVVATTTTDADGNYAFEDLPAGTYSVGYTNSSIYIPDSSIPGNVDPNTWTWPDSQVDGIMMITEIQLDPGEDSIDNDFGLIAWELVNIYGTIFYDDEDDDSYIWDMPIEGQEVKLLDEDGNVIATTMTDADGNYAFEGLLAWTYAVMYTNNSWFVPDSSIPGNVDPNTWTWPDSQADGIMMITEIQLDRGEDSVDNDFGLIAWEPVAIYGTIYFDNEDDDNYTGDAPIPWQEVKLLDENWNLIAITMTDGDGNYSFEWLPAGNYQVMYTNTSVYTSDSTNPGVGATELNLMMIDIPFLYPGEQSPENDFWLIYVAGEGWSGWGGWWRSWRVRPVLDLPVLDLPVDQGNNEPVQVVSEPWSILDEVVWNESPLTIVEIQEIEKVIMEKKSAPVRNIDVDVPEFVWNSINLPTFLPATGAY